MLIPSNDKRFNRRRVLALIVIYGSFLVLAFAA